MNTINSYKDLDVYQKAMELVVEIYDITKEFPEDEKYGLVTQMRRAAVSIASNIAEGYRRKGLGDYIRFLAISHGSAAELETQIEICRRIKWLEKYDFARAEKLDTDVSKMLLALIRSLNRKK